MTITAPKLEKLILRLAKREMRLNTTLWRDYKRSRRRWWQDSQRTPVYPVAIAILALFVYFTAEVAKASVVSACIAIAFYATATTISRGTSFFSNALYGRGRWTLYFLPMSDEDLLAHKWLRFVVSWLRAFVIFTFLFGAALYRAKPLSGFQVAVILSAAFLQTLSGLCLSIWIAHYWKPGWIRFLPYGLIGTMLLPRPVEESLWQALLITPAGWVMHGLMGCSGLGPNVERWWFVPAIALVATTPWAKKVIHKELLDSLSAQATAPEQFIDDDGQPIVEEAPTSSSVPSLEITRDFLKPESFWTEGAWMERWLGRMFNAREKIVAEFMLGDEVPEWTKYWLIGLLLMAIVIAMCLVPVPTPAWMITIPISLWAAAVLSTIPLFGGTWSGLSVVAAWGPGSPPHGLLPVGYDETCCVILRINFVRLLPWLPTGVIATALLAEEFRYSSARAAALGLGFGLALCILQPALVAVQFMLGVSSRRTDWPTLSFTVGSLGAMVAVGYISLLIFGTRFHGIWLCVFVTLSVCSFLCWIGARLALHHGRVDLLSPTATS